VRLLGFSSSLLTLLLVTHLPAQSPAVLLEGDIVNATTGAAIPNARIKLEKLPKDFYAKADNQGHFQFAAVPPGNYMWSVESPGFLPVERNPLSLAGTATSRDVAPRRAAVETAKVTRYDAADGTPHFKLTVPLTAYAVITGRVTDPYGLPAEDCRISVVGADGNPVRSGRAFTTAIGQLRTDEKGEFRAAGLPPGAYYVSATMTFLRDTSLRTTYFPGAIDQASAKPVQLSAGQKTRTDIQIVQLTGVQITGRVISPPDSPAADGRARTNVELIPSLPARGEGRNTGVASSAGDSFLFSNVLPGKYTLMALTTIQPEGARPRDSKSAAGLMREVEVSSQNIDLLDLALQPIHDISGAVTFAGGCAPRPLQIALRPAGGLATSGRPATVTFGADGKFVVTGIGVGTFTVEALPRMNPAVQLRSIRLGDRDVLRDGLTSPSTGDDQLLITVDCTTPNLVRLP